MSILEKLRLYHAALAILAIAAYLTGEAGIVHAWLGYGVAAIIVFRIVWGIFGPRQLGIARFLPKLSDVGNVDGPDHPLIGRVLILGIVVSLLAVSGTGIAMDRFRSLPAVPSAVAAADQARVPMTLASERYEEGEDESEEWLEEVHEASANLLFLFVGLHVTYLLLFKRKLAAFMLFRNATSDKPV